MANSFSNEWIKQLVMDNLATLVLIVFPQKTGKKHVQHGIADVFPTISSFRTVLSMTGGCYESFASLKMQNAGNSRLATMFLAWTLRSDRPTSNGCSTKCL